MSTIEPPLVKLAGVSKCYPKMASSRDRLRALRSALWRSRAMPTHSVLDGINLEVFRGQSLGVIGENGAGKSTLLKLIASVITPSSGSVVVNGRVGALLELGAGFHPEYPGRENIRLSAALLGMEERDLDEKLAAIIEFADIGDYIDEPIKHYSSGMVVRLGFAIITAIQPELLITDEVLAVGDESFQRKCIRWMEHYLADGGTLLLCSHGMYHIQKLCQKACWIHQGQMHLYGDALHVSQAYLAYHEEKNTVAVDRSETTVTGLGKEYRMAAFALQGQDQAAEMTLQIGEDLRVSGQVYSPDDRPPVVAVGIMRGDVPVYGVSSEIDGFVLNRIEPGLFSFHLSFANPPLLPGKYSVRGHAMDPEAMRLLDTVERGFTVTGTTREVGFCRLPHRWSAAARIATVDAEQPHG